MYKKYFSLAIILLITGCSNEYLDVDSCQSKGVLDLICDMQNPEDFAKIPAGALETLEKLEQLRALENGKRIAVEIVAHGTIGVDTREDLDAIEFG